MEFYCTMNLKLIVWEGANGIDVPPVTNKWQAVVNSVMNCQIL